MYLLNIKGIIIFYRWYDQMQPYELKFSFVKTAVPPQWSNSEYLLQINKSKYCHPGKLRLHHSLDYK